MKPFLYIYDNSEYANVFNVHIIIAETDPFRETSNERISVSKNAKLNRIKCFIKFSTAEYCFAPKFKTVFRVFGNFNGSIPT